MTYEELLEKTINTGIEAAKKSYTRPDQKQKLSGSLAGFEACRGKTLSELVNLWQASEIATRQATLEQKEDYWWYRCYELEVDWVCNVISAGLLANKMPVIKQPTYRGVMHYQNIITGVI